MYTKLLVLRAKKCLTSRCSTTPALRACVGQFLSCGFVVLLRKSIPQNHNLKTAAELGVIASELQIVIHALVQNAYH
jgi:uncharacterized membrane protein YjfL (UPF0719 family)